MHDDERNLWNKYTRDRDVETRNELAERYLPLVKNLANRVYLRGSVIEFDDMVAAGVIGLLQAIASYRPDKGFAPSTFLRRRIVGAMLDQMRALDDMDRRTRAHLKRCAAIADELGREPSAGELADALGRSVTESAAVLVLRNARFGNAEWIPDDRPSDRSAAELQDTHRHLTRGLNSNEQAAVCQYFFQGRTMRQIGLSLGVAESRVSQIIAGAIARLRAVRNYETERAAI